MGGWRTAGQVTRKDGGSARKYRALGYPANSRLPFGTFSHGRCPRCGKINYASRKDARRAAAVHHPEDNELRAYKCPRGTHWHYGHIPDWKVQGYENHAAWLAAQEGKEMDDAPKNILRAVAREGGTAYIGSLSGLTHLDRALIAEQVGLLVRDGYLTRGGQRVTLTANGRAEVAR